MAFRGVFALTRLWLRRSLGVGEGQESVVANSAAIAALPPPALAAGASLSAIVGIYLRGQARARDIVSRAVGVRRDCGPIATLGNSWLVGMEPRAHPVEAFRAGGFVR